MVQLDECFLNDYTTHQRSDDASRLQCPKLVFVLRGHLIKLCVYKCIPAVYPSYQLTMILHSLSMAKRETLLDLSLKDRGQTFVYEDKCNDRCASVPPTMPMNQQTSN